MFVICFINIDKVGKKLFVVLHAGSRESDFGLDGVEVEELGEGEGVFQHRLVQAEERALDCDFELLSL
jgi:hypothetical protein